MSLENHDAPLGMMKIWHFLQYSYSLIYWIWPLGVDNIATNYSRYKEYSSGFDALCTIFPLPAFELSCTAYSNHPIGSAIIDNSRINTGRQASKPELPAHTVLGSREILDNAACSINEHYAPNSSGQIDNHRTRFIAQYRDPFLAASGAMCRGSIKFIEYRQATLAFISA
jgi:hypothetical protein